MDKNTYAERADAMKHRLYRTALMYLGESDASEAVDEAVYRGFKACGRLLSEQYFSTWLTRILINVCKTELKRRRRIGYLPTLRDSESGENLTAQTPSGYLHGELGKTDEQTDLLPLRDAVNRLPPDLREVIILRYFSDLTLEQTAKALGLPRGTVTSRQTKALSILRKELNDNE